MHDFAIKNNFLFQLRDDTTLFYLTLIITTSTIIYKKHSP
jgi:hypothetical protein